MTTIPRRTDTQAVRFCFIAMILAAALAGPSCQTMVTLPPVTPPSTPPPPPPAPPPGGGTTGGGTSSVVTDLTVLEQLALERVNRARLRPAAEAARFGIDLNEGLPAGTISARSKQAVAVNPMLTAAARAHAQDMLQRNYFEHNAPEGTTPFDRMRAAGYLFRSAGENLAWSGTTGTLDPVQTVENEHRDLFVDTDIPDRGHRVVMLIDNFKEAGVGVRRGNFTFNAVTYDSIMQAMDFGTTANSPAFVTGVVYSDLNRNGQYDAGEGTPNVTITLGTASTATNSAGGYSIAVSTPANYTILFATGGPTMIPVGSANVKVDQIDGSRVEINFGLGPL